MSYLLMWEMIGHLISPRWLDDQEERRQGRRSFSGLGR